MADALTVRECLALDLERAAVQLERVAGGLAPAATWRAPFDAGGLAAADRDAVTAAVLEARRHADELRALAHALAPDVVAP